MEQPSELTVALEMLNRVPGAQECDATGVKQSYYSRAPNLLTLET
jgi:hypothetical protein